MLRRFILLLLLPVTLFSCEKPEKALELPPPSGASYMVLDLGPEYDRQIFFDFASGKPVHTSDPKSWDLAFESGAGQRHIFINGGEKAYIHNTHKTSLDDVTALPAGLSLTGSGWSYDMPCGMSDSTAIGDWFTSDGASRGEVYVMQTSLPSRTLVKLRILSLEENAYQIEWAPIAARGGATKATIHKDTTANFSYFSFTGGQTFPEPKKETWDIVFTRYRHVYRKYLGNGDFPYEVTGVLLNPMRTRAVPDSLTGFEHITRELALTKTPSPYRDAIGFAWKDYSSNTGYIVKRINCYIVWTQHGEVYKMHFLDYYNNGQQGSPSFEYMRLM